MSILIDKNTQVLVQGITGKEGSRATKEMLNYGTQVLCGVTPGKGGQFVEDCPVFDTVKEAVKNFPNITTSVLYVPPFAAKSSVFEAIDSGIKFLVLITETIPIHDVAKIIAYVKLNNARLIGPSSIGIISSGKSKLGSIGGNSNVQYKKGPIGIISKSGGMCSETAMLLKSKDFGTSTVIGIGGDVLVGTDYVDLLELFENDDDTKVIVLFGEIGGLLEEAAADYIKNNIKKPVIAFISGLFAENLPRISLGHAGAIIEGEETTRASKVHALRNAGVLIADFHHEIVELVEKVLKEKGNE